MKRTCAVDFHTHIFPDTIAEKTIEFLSKKANIPAFSNGTLTGLDEALKKADVDFGVSLPVLTKPESFESVLAFAERVNEGFKRGQHRILSFAGIHPNCGDIEEKTARIKAKGFKGIKIHPEYQDTYIDDERYLRILRSAAKEDLIVVTHSGVDAGYLGCVHCTPRRILNVFAKLDKIPKLVLAHLGACEMYEEVLELLCGTPTYFDTAYVLKFLPRDIFLRIVEKHGVDKILFASDSPWQSVVEMRETLFEMPLQEEVKDKILYKNAMELLKMN